MREDGLWLRGVRVLFRFVCACKDMVIGVEGERILAISRICVGFIDSKWWLLTIDLGVMFFCLCFHVCLESYFWFLNIVNLTLYISRQVCLLFAFM